VPETRVTADTEERMLPLARSAVTTTAFNG